MPHADYVVALALLLLGLHGMLFWRSLVRKLLAMGILQVAVIVFFVSLAAKSGAQPPIAPEAGVAPHADAYVNPLPHALMLTAIVVGVSTMGVGLAFVVRVHRRYGTLDERELLRRMRE